MNTIYIDTLTLNNPMAFHSFTENNFILILLVSTPFQIKRMHVLFRISVKTKYKTLKYFPLEKTAILRRKNNQII